MKYFKIVQNNKIINVADESCLRVFQPKNRLLLYCKKEEAQYIQINETTFYHDYWMLPVTTNKFSYQLASIEEISIEEYNELYEILKEGKEIYLPEEIEIEDIDSVEISEDIISARKNKISEINLLCKKTIQSGFDVILSDEETYHFSLEITDQLNILKLYNKALARDSFLPYHADGKLCENFSQQDIFTIYNKMEETISYQTIYCNSLKNYILNLQDIEEIKKVKYGIKIPIEYQSEVLKGLIGG